MYMYNTGRLNWNFEFPGGKSTSHTLINLSVCSLLFISDFLKCAVSVKSEGIRKDGCCSSLLLWR